MPQEKFYDSRAVEGSLEAVPVLTVGWPRAVERMADSVVHLNGVAFDSSGVSRLIDVLQKAQRTFAMYCCYIYEDGAGCASDAVIYLVQRDGRDTHSCAHHLLKLIDDDTVDTVLIQD